MFKYGIYKNLIEVIDNQDEEDRMEFHAILKDALCDCVKYVDTVACIEASMPMIMTSFEGADLRARITALDSERRAAHEAAIAQVAIINRVADMVGVEHLYTGPLEDRYEVGNFCNEVASALFANRGK